VSENRVYFWASGTVDDCDAASGHGWGTMSLGFETPFTLSLTVMQPVSKSTSAKNIALFIIPLE
jgi:hypothetical protein